jgi:hypothetical protein
LVLVLVLAAAPGLVPAKAQAEAIWHSEFGLTYFLFDYAETLSPPSKSQEKGWLPGLRYVSQDGKGNSRNRTELELAIGTTDYDGSLQDASGKYAGPYKAKTPNRIFVFEREWGRARAQEDGSFTQTPYYGLGYRYWFRGKESSDTYGYDEAYHEAQRNGNPETTSAEVSGFPLRSNPDTPNAPRFHACPTEGSLPPSAEYPTYSADALNTDN